MEKNISGIRKFNKRFKRKKYFNHRWYWDGWYATAEIVIQIRM